VRCVEAYFHLNGLVERRRVEPLQIIGVFGRANTLMERSTSWNRF
jgi:hypothetical protein